MIFFGRGACALFSCNMSTRELGVMRNSELQRRTILLPKWICYHASFLYRNYLDYE
jgi:hypothetical protein